MLCGGGCVPLSHQLLNGTPYCGPGPMWLIHVHNPGDHASVGAGQRLGVLARYPDWPGSFRMREKIEKAKSTLQLVSYSSMTMLSPSNNTRGLLGRRDPVLPISFAPYYWYCRVISLSTYHGAFPLIYLHYSGPSNPGKCLSDDRGTKHPNYQVGRTLFCKRFSKAPPWTSSLTEEGKTKKLGPLEIMIQNTLDTHVKILESGGAPPTGVGTGGFEALSESVASGHGVERW